MALTNPTRGGKDDVRSRQAIQQLSHLRLGSAASVTFADLTLSGLTASRLVWSDAGKKLASKDLVDLVAGTLNRIIVTDNGSGGVVISAPQDIHTDASPEFAGVVLKDSGDITYFHADENIIHIETL